MPEIIILGAGFGALTAVREIKKQKLKAKITLIAPRPIFEYFPSAIWIPYGLRTVSNLTVPLDNFFKKHNVNYIAANVNGLSSDSNLVLTDNGEFSYDYLIVATGGRFIKKLPGLTEHAIIPCAGLEAGEEYRQRLKKMSGGTIAFGFSSNPNEPAAMRGGPVFEFLFGTDAWLKKQGLRDKFNLVFFSPAKEPGKRMGKKAVGALLNRMQKQNIKIYLGKKILEITANEVITTGAHFKSDLNLFMPGMTGPAWIENSSLTQSAGGFIQANTHTLAINTDNVYVAGDAGSFPGPAWQPKQAHMADLQAACAVKNIQAQLKNLPAQHTFKTELACIIDSLDTGVLVYRNEKSSWMFKSKLLHYAKRLFEWYYLRSIRS